MSVRPAPGSDWLSIVEFDIHVPSDPADVDGDYYAEERRVLLLNRLQDLLLVPASSLYSGFITSKIDPTYHKYFPSSSDDHSAPFSTDFGVLEIMNKYKDVVIPSEIVDMSHFYIYLMFEGVRKQLRVPNPYILRKKFCNLWPFEVKQALGFIGTMQEIWIEPVSLIPRGVPREISKAIFFEPSARLNGAIVINASRLKADLIYDVQCQDYRGEVIKTLTEEERASIKETFDEYDVDGSGSISRGELEALVRSRTAQRKAVIDSKYTEFMQDGRTSQEAARAEEQKRMLYQQLSESQNRLVKMFEAADTDGNGQLSFTEFLLAEAWWIRCTLNPEHAHLF